MYNEKFITWYRKQCRLRYKAQYKAKRNCGKITQKEYERKCRIVCFWSKQMSKNPDLWEDKNYETKHC